MSTDKKPDWVRLPTVAPDLHPPSETDKDEWAAQYMRMLGKLAGDGISDPEERVREEIEYANRDKHPRVKRFHLEALKLAIERRARPPVGWEVRRWTREDVIAAVEQDKREGGSGSKWRIGNRARTYGYDPSAVWRRWEQVRREGESWPSGNKGPANRR